MTPLSVDIRSCDAGIFSHLLKSLGPLEPASLGKLSEWIKIVFAVGISSENLSGIVRWPFISLKQPLADFFGRVKDLVGRCQPDACHL